MDRARLHTVIQLARLYGIAETLHPLRPRSNDDISALILSWADEYIRSGAQDLSGFFARVVAPEYED